MTPSGKGINFAAKTNLYRKRESQKAFNKILLGAFLMLLITMLAYGGVYMFKKKQEKSLENIKLEIQQAKDSRNFTEIAQVLDSVNRLNFVAEMSKNQKMWSPIFHDIEGKMMQSLYIEEFTGKTSFQFENTNEDVLLLSDNGGGEEQIELNMISQNLGDISKQTKAFSLSNNFKDISIGSISLEDKGLTFKMTITPKENALTRANLDNDGINKIDDSTDDDELNEVMQ